MSRRGSGGVGTELRWRRREPTVDATTPSSPPFKMNTECSVLYRRKIVTHKTLGVSQSITTKTVL
jgi:hypothetical protein